MGIKDRLTEEQKFRYDQLYVMSKIAYPDLLEQMYEDTIHYYITHNEDDKCFQELINLRTTPKQKEIYSNDILDD